MTEKQRIIAGAVELLVYGRFSKESLEEELSMIFEEPIKIELGCEDVDYLTDWNYMFTSNQKEWGGDLTYTFCSTRINAKVLTEQHLW